MTNNPMTSLKTKSTHQLVPCLVALTLLYSLVYHIMMFRAVLQEDVTQDDCDKVAHAGGVIPPQCLELEVFKDWHEKDAELQELLVEAAAPEDQIQAVPAAGVNKKTDTAVVVDDSGETFAVSISEDLAGLQEKVSQLVVSGVHLDVKKDELKRTDGNPAKTIGALQDLMHHELGEHKDATSEKHVDAGGPDAGHPDFATFHAQMEARHKERTEKRAILIHEIAQRMGKLDMKLSDVVSDRKAWESTLLEKYDAANVTGHKDMEPVPSSSAFMPKRLQWSAIPTVHHHKAKSPDFLEGAPKGPIVVSKGDVRHLHWTGQLPIVAAIAWIRGDSKTRARMMYFVDNFKLQDYEGTSQLLLVYHYKDEAAFNIVSKYVDGVNVKGVAAHDFSQESFPSDPALRYAAWASDADVVAQWDFDEWHDPSRLSLQVRAMAHTGKHACVLSTSSTSHSQEDEAKEISVVSLVGERSWMKEHWHPFSRRKLEVTETFLAGELVELNMQNKALMNNISRIEHVFIETTKAAIETTKAAIESTKAALPAQHDAQSIAQEVEEPKEGKADKADQGTEFSRDISECLSYDTSKGHDSEDAAQKAMTANVGEDFGKKFHDLVKRRHDITMKLQLLCFQSTMEKDHGKRKFMHEHVLEMDHIRVELDKHITSMASLFGGPNLQDMKEKAENQLNDLIQG